MCFGGGLRMFWGGTNWFFTSLGRDYRTRGGLTSALGRDYRNRGEPDECFGEGQAPPRPPQPHHWTKFRGGGLGPPGPHPGCGLDTSSVVWYKTQFLCDY